MSDDSGEDRDEMEARVASLSDSLHRVIDETNDLGNRARYYRDEAEHLRREVERLNGEIAALERAVHDLGGELADRRERDELAARVRLHRDAAERLLFVAALLRQAPADEPLPASLRRDLHTVLTGAAQYLAPPTLASDAS
jgi:HK97 family phage major capsid protein